MKAVIATYFTDLKSARKEVLAMNKDPYLRRIEPMIIQTKNGCLVLGRRQAERCGFGVKELSTGSR